MFSFGVLPSKYSGSVAGRNADEAKQKLFLREEKDFALLRLFLFWGRTSAAQEGAGGMRDGFVFDFRAGAMEKIAKKA